MIRRAAMRREVKLLAVVLACSVVSAQDDDDGGPEVHACLSVCLSLRICVFVSAVFVCMRVLLAFVTLPLARKKNASI